MITNRAMSQTLVSSRATGRPPYIFSSITRTAAFGRIAIVEVAMERSSTTWWEQSGCSTQTKALGFWQLPMLQMKQFPHDLRRTNRMNMWWETRKDSTTRVECGGCCLCLAIALSRFGLHRRWCRLQRYIFVISWASGIGTRDSTSSCHRWWQNLQQTMDLLWEAMHSMHSTIKIEFKMQGSRIIFKMIYPKTFLFCHQVHIVTRFCQPFQSAPSGAIIWWLLRHAKHFVSARLCWKLEMWQSTCDHHRWTSTTSYFCTQLWPGGSLQTIG